VKENKVMVEQNTISIRNRAAFGGRRRGLSYNLPGLAWLYVRRKNNRGNNNEWLSSNKPTPYKSHFNNSSPLLK